jgi:hypothetical protein
MKRRVKMIPKDESLIVKLVKKSVGLPTGKSGCCGPVAPAATVCCDAEPFEEAPADCGCGSDASKEQEPADKA